MKVKINLDTNSAVNALVAAATSISDPVYLVDNNGLKVSAKSLLGVVYVRFEFNEIWLECEGDHYFIFKDFIAE